jgi:cation transporter-like permease
MYHFNIHKLLHFAHTMYLGVMYDSRNKHELFPNTIINQLVSVMGGSVLCEVENKLLNIIYTEFLF